MGNDMDQVDSSCPLGLGDAWEVYLDVGCAARMPCCAGLQAASERARRGRRESRDDLSQGDVDMDADGRVVDKEVPGREEVIR